MGYESRVNGLKLKTSTGPAKGAVPLVTNIPVGGPPVPNRASNNPGPMTSPSAQGPNHPGTTQAPEKPYTDI